MQRKKRPRLVITFPSTTAAMAMEAACSPALGRLIPLPRQIGAGCGLAWCASPEQKDMLMALISANSIPYQQACIVSLYES